MKNLHEHSRPGFQVLFWAACVVAGFPLCSAAQRNLKDIPDPDPEVNGVIQVFVQTVVVGNGFSGFNEPAPTYSVGREPTDVALGDYGAFSIRYSNC